MAETFHPGRLAKLYYNSATYATPTWVEGGRVGDVSGPTSKNTSAVTTRESPNQKTIIGSKIFQITGTMYEKVQDDSVLEAFKACFLADSPGATDGTLEIAMMNQDITVVGATGLRGFYHVTSFERSEPVGDAVSRSFTLDEVDHEESGTVIDVEAYTITL